jgi:hypothetical protein
MPLSSLDNWYISTYGPSGLNVLQHYYPCNESSGSILDQVGSLNGTAGSQITYGQSSILPASDSATCLQSTNNASTNIGSVNFSSNFGSYPKSYECWFKHSSSGTPLFQDGNLWIGYWGAVPGFGLFVVGGGTANYTASFTPVAGTVYHLVLTTDGTAAGTSVYINGVSQTMTTTGVPATPSGANASIMGAASSTGGGSGMLGYGEKFAVYNVVLTSTQVVNNYIAGQNGGPPTVSIRTPTSFWRLEEATGTRIDSASGGNDLTTISGAPGNTAAVLGNGLSVSSSSSQYVQAPSSASLTLNSASGFSFSAWFKLNSVTGTQDFGILGKATVATGLLHQFEYELSWSHTAKSVGFAWVDTTNTFSTTATQTASPSNSVNTAVSGIMSSLLLTLPVQPVNST